MVRKRFLFTIFTVVAILAITLIAIFFAKGYQISPQTGTIAGTGIISVVSSPDQASVYLDGHLVSVTNDTINSLQPGEYQVRIVKDGYIPWEKKIAVNVGLVTDVKATLFRAIPGINPQTYSGAANLTVSPDQQKIVYVVPPSEDLQSPLAKKSGVWVWEMAQEQGLGGINRGGENRQIIVGNGVDYRKGQFRWSPDSDSLMISFPDRNLLAEVDRLNDPPKDITPLVQGTLSEWGETESKNRLAKLQLIKDVNLRKEASESAVLKWSQDETKVLYQASKDKTFKVADLLLGKQFNLPDAKSYEWLSDPEQKTSHLVMIEYDQKEKDKKTDSDRQASASGQLVANPGFVTTKLSIVEVDGQNKSEIYVGNINPEKVVPWPDGSRILVISSLATATASQPNLYWINLK